MYVFQCSDDFDHILTAIYNAWSYGLKYGHDSIRIDILPANGGCLQPMLFDTAMPVMKDDEKAAKVAASVRKKVSEEAYEWIYMAYLSAAPEKATVIYHFLTTAFRLGRRATHAFGRPEVMDLFELSRYAANEGNQYREFLRFSSFGNRLLFAKIEPVNHVLPVIMPHFAERFNTEQFIILDQKRKLAGVYRPDFDSAVNRDVDSEQGWVLTDAPVLLEQLPAATALTEGADDYAGLWKAFVHAIAIAERTNSRCQRSNLPLRFRPLMTEF